MESQTERSRKLDWFGCGVGLHSAENNRSCGGVRDGLAVGRVTFLCEERKTTSLDAGG